MPYDDLEDEGEVKVGVVFTLVITALIILAIFFMSSCTYGDANHAVAVGGKGAYKGKAFAMNWDNEKSFNDVAWVAMAAVPAIQAVKVAQSADKLSGIENTNAAKTSINATNAAAATEQLKISSGAEVIKATTLPK